MALSPTLTVMTRALEKAARNLIRDFNEVEKLQISVKGPGDFVSRADKRAEEILVENLLRDRPEWGFLNEEGGTINGTDPRYRWIVDPLDGTNNFLHGVPHWCTTVALEKDGEIVAGVTLDPVRNEMFRTEKGGGAFMNNTRLRVSGRKELSTCQVALDVGYRFRQPDALNEFMQVWQKTGETGANLRHFGSGALDLAYVAAGRFDVFMHWQAKPWDIAAGMLMVREAAGIVTDLSLKTATLEKGEVLAANPALHKIFAAHLKDARAAA